MTTMDPSIGNLLVSLISAVSVDMPRLPHVLLATAAVIYGSSHHYDPWTWRKQRFASVLMATPLAVSLTVLQVGRAHQAAATTEEGYKYLSGDAHRWYARPRKGALAPQVEDVVGGVQ